MIRRVLECVGVLGMIGMIGCGGGSSSSGTPRTPTATDTRSFTVGSMSGNWTVTAPGYGTILLTLTQSGSLVTGSFSAPQGFGNAPPGSGGQTDPAEPGRIKPNGEVEIRLKVGRFLDFYLR